MADMRNIGFATIFAAIVASSSFRAFAFSWPSLIILCCFVYFLRYADKWCIFYGQYFQAEGSFWWSSLFIVDVNAPQEESKITNDTRKRSSEWEKKKKESGGLWGGIRTSD